MARSPLFSGQYITPANPDQHAARMSVRYSSAKSGKPGEALGYVI
jgi:hypothetical protein